MEVKQIFVGKPKTVGSKDAIDPMEREWTSGIFKEPVEGAIWLGSTKLEGDGQADLKNHGGPEKAVFAYPASHYSYWQEEHRFLDMKPGGMGENFSITNGFEEDVCIGDTYKIGDAIVQVSQPRQPCWKPARRFKQKNLALLIQDTGRTGWYFRVLQEGMVESRQVLQLLDRPYPKWTIEFCNHIMHVDKENIEKSRELMNVELLANNWKRTLVKRVDQGIQSDIRKRVIGPNE